MSKQQGTNFPELEERKSKKRKKRKGVYELWMRYNPPDKTKSIFSQDWHCIRKYETMELAEENLAASKRKWPSDFWELEIRVRNEK